MKALPRHLLASLLLTVSLLQLPVAAEPAAQPAQDFNAPFALPGDGSGSFAGDWQGAIQLPGQELKVNVHLQADAAGKWTGSIDIPQQQAKGLPLTDIQVQGQAISFKISGIPGEPTFKGQLAGRELSGSFTQGGQNFAFRLQADDAVRQAQLATDQGKLESDLSSLAQQALVDWKTPGIAVAVVKDGHVLLIKGFGMRDLEHQLPVTVNTLFAIGSSTKAFTATALGMMVDDGKLDWDQPIHELLPDFALQDPVASTQMSARDLLTHRSGLPRHDVAWYGSSRTRQQLYQSLKFLQPTAAFRSRFQYQNLMFMTAGLLLERLSGKSWESFVQERIFTPLDMDRATTSSAAAIADADHAMPYVLKQDKPVLIPFRTIDALGPAGGIYAAITDMALWLKFNLGDGKSGDKQVLESATLRQLQSPQVVVSSSGSPESPYTLYGMGWFIQPYRGHTLVQHGGNIDGFTAMVGLLPQDDVGVVVLSNKNSDMLPTALLYSLCDRLLALGAIDWHTRLKGGIPDDGQIKQAAYPQVQGTHPSHALKDYTGLFAHPAYGELQVETRAGGLRLNFRDLGGPLKHWHYDSFRVENPDSAAGGQMLSFITDEFGDIVGLQMAMEPEADPIRFTRQSEPRLSLPAVLQQYTGTYTLGATPIQVQLLGHRLLIQVAGQPPFELVPYREHLFRLKGYAGYMARFELKNGKVVAVDLIQPNGVFKAEKK